MGPIIHIIFIYNQYKQYKHQSDFGMHEDLIDPLDKIKGMKESMQEFGKDMKIGPLYLHTLLGAAALCIPVLMLGEASILRKDSLLRELSSSWAMVCVCHSILRGTYFYSGPLCIRAYS